MDFLDPAILQYAKELTQSAALASMQWIGRGNENEADQAAVSAMRNHFNLLPLSGQIVIGEGERDEAPMLYIGENVGMGGMKVDIAVDPLEGTGICASAMPNSMSVIAIANEGNLLRAPDVYMEKIAIGIRAPEPLVDLDLTPAQIIKNLSLYKKCSPSELTVCILKRDRHEEIIAKTRETGAKVCLIGDGDVAAVIATSMKKTGIDMYYGIGGAPEGVLAAAALACVGGFIQGRLIYRNDEEKARAQSFGISDLNKKYSIADMIKGDVVFAATGITDGWLLKGVRKTSKYVQFETLCMHRDSKLVSVALDKYFN